MSKAKNQKKTMWWGLIESIHSGYACLQFPINRNVWLEWSYPTVWLEINNGVHPPLSMARRKGSRKGRISREQERKRDGRWHGLLRAWIGRPMFIRAEHAVFTNDDKSWMWIPRASFSVCIPYEYKSNSGREKFVFFRNFKARDKFSLWTR